MKLGFAILTVRHLWRKDLMVYYGMQIGGLAIPFILVPFFARVLGASGFGALTIGQAFAILISSFVEYGFQVTGTRKISSCRSTPEEVSKIAANVLSAKIALTFFVIMTIPIFYICLPFFHHHPEILISSALFGIFQGFSFYWLFGGMQKYYFAGFLEFGAKLLAALIILLLIRSSNDVWLVLLIFAGSQGIFVGVGAIAYINSLPTKLLSVRKAYNALSEGRYIFATNTIGIIYTGTNAFLLGLVAPPIQVGYFSGAEKIIRAVLLPMQPLRQVFFPVVAERIARSPADGAKALRLASMIAIPVALLGCILLFVLAPFLVHIILGDGMAGAVSALRIMSVLPVLGLANEVISVFWMMPNKMDKLLTKIVAVVVVVHMISMATFGAALPAAIGGAIAVTGSTALSLVLFSIAICKRKHTVSSAH